MLSTVYGVTSREVEEFKVFPSVRMWLGKFNERTAQERVYVLCRFFKWLRVVKGMDFKPDELLNSQVELRGSRDVRARRQHLKWVLEHSRDNADFKDYSDNRKYEIFLTIKGFYDYHETTLTSAKNVFGQRRKRKNRRKQITLAQAKKIVSLLPQREKTVLLIILQSGMEIGAVLDKMNFMWDRVVGQVEAGKLRVKVEFEGRKGNGLDYFTYFSYDAVQELKKWLLIRERIVLEHGEAVGKPIFLTHQGTGYTINNYYQNIDYWRRKKELPRFVTHQFRKLFKTEASIPERGVDRDIVEFWMGHNSKIASTGGIYNKVPEIHEDVVEREYMKLEPFLNIYSSKVAMREADPLLEKVSQLSEIPGVREEFEHLADKLEVIIDQALRKQGLGHIK